MFGSPVIPSSIRSGISTYLLRRYDESAFIHAITKYQISETYVAPPILRGLSKSPLSTKESLASLRDIYTGGAAIHEAQLKPLYDVMPADAVVRRVWGLTEAGWVTTLQAERSIDDSVGLPLPGYDLM